MLRCSTNARHSAAPRSGITRTAPLGSSHVGSAKTAPAGRDRLRAAVEAGFPQRLVCHHELCIRARRTKAVAKPLAYGIHVADWKELDSHRLIGVCQRYFC
jgi:hypothetical protein